MTGKKELYVIITILISLSLVFGSINYNFSAESISVSNISNATGNNSTAQNVTLQTSNNSSITSNQTIVSPTNQTINSQVENQSKVNIIPNDINRIFHLFTANITSNNTTDAQDPLAAAGASTTGIITQTGKLPAIKSDLSLNQCLKQTVNAQSKDPRIKSLAKKITKGVTSKYKKAVKLFKWVRDNIGYSFYYNTKYGAVKTLKKKTGNCVDTSHLLVSLLRASGIPARYVHVRAKFPDGQVYGHVFVQAYVKGKWCTVDASSTRNSFDIIRKWDKGTAEIKGVYASLPF